MAASLRPDGLGSRGPPREERARATRPETPGTGEGRAQGQEGSRRPRARGRGRETRYLPVEHGVVVHGGGGVVWRRGQRQQRQQRLARGRPARQPREQRRGEGLGRCEQQGSGRDPGAQPEQPGRAGDHPNPGWRRLRVCIHRPEEMLPPPGLLLLLQLPPPPLEPGAHQHPTSPRERRRRGRRAPEVRAGGGAGSGANSLGSAARPLAPPLPRAGSPSSRPPPSPPSAAARAAAAPGPGPASQRPRTWAPAPPASAPSPARPGPARPLTGPPRRRAGNGGGARVPTIPRIAPPGSGAAAGGNRLSRTVRTAGEARTAGPGSQNPRAEASRGQGGCAQVGDVPPPGRAVAASGDHCLPGLTQVKGTGPRGDAGCRPQSQEGINCRWGRVDFSDNLTNTSLRPQWVLCPCSPYPTSH